MLVPGLHAPGGFSSPAQSDALSRSVHWFLPGGSSRFLWEFARLVVIRGVGVLEVVENER